MYEIYEITEVVGGAVYNDDATRILHARGNCVSPWMLLKRGWKTEQQTERERERERDRRSHRSLAAHRAYRRAYIVAINISRRHLPDRSHVCEENDEITRKPPAVRYGRVMLEYRVINFRERRLSRVSVALYAPEITIRSFPLSIALLALWRTAVGSHALVTTSCNRYREQTTFHAVASERFRPPCNIAESAVDSNKFEASLIEAPNDNDNTIWCIVYLLFTRAREN